MGTIIMFDSPLTIALSVVMFIGFLLIAIATPPLIKGNKQLEAKIARKRKLHLDDGY